MEHWARFKCILTKNIFVIFDLWTTVTTLMSLSMVYCIQKMILRIEIYCGKSEEMQSDRAQFMTNSANGCRKDMLIFCIFKRLSSLLGFS